MDKGVTSNLQLTTNLKTSQAGCILQAHVIRDRDQSIFIDLTIQNILKKVLNFRVLE